MKRIMIKEDQMKIGYYLPSHVWWISVSCNCAASKRSIDFVFSSVKTSAGICVIFEKSGNSLKPSSTDTLKGIKLSSVE